MPGMPGIKGEVGPPGPQGHRGTKGDQGEAFNNDILEGITNTTMEKIHAIEEWFNQTFEKGEEALEVMYKGLDARLVVAEERPMKPGPKGDKGYPGDQVNVC